MHRLSSFTLVATLLLLTLVTFQNTQARTVFICRPGQTYTLSGTTSPSTALLLLFDGSHVGGTTSGPDGKYRLQLAMGNERPGDYLLEVQVRASRQIIREALCRVPASDEEGEQAAPPAQASEATPTASLTSQPVGANPTSTTSSQTGGGNGSAPSPTLSPSVTDTRGSTGGSTQTASVTPSASLTPSRTPTRSTTQQASTATATATRTVTQSNVDASEYELLAEVDEEDPVVGEVVSIFGTLVKVATNHGVTDVQINVSYSFSGGSGVWCNTTIEDPDGYWECDGTITNAMAYKDVVLTVQAIVNGKPLQTQVTIRPYSEGT